MMKIMLMQDIKNMKCFSLVMTCVRQREPYSICRPPYHYAKVCADTHARKKQLLTY